MPHVRLEVTAVSRFARDRLYSPESWFAPFARAVASPLFVVAALVVVLAMMASVGSAAYNMFGVQTLLILALVGSACLLLSAARTREKARDTLEAAHTSELMGRVQNIETCLANIAAQLSSLDSSLQSNRADIVALNEKFDNFLNSPGVRMFDKVGGDPAPVPEYIATMVGHVE